MKNILIIANFCGDFSENDNGRFKYICNELSKKHKVEIVTSDFRHTKKKTRTYYPCKNPFKITFLHEPGYKQNVSCKRMYSHYIWGRNLKKYLSRRERPDVVYCAIPSLTAANVALEFCKKHNVRFIIDIQDLWPESFKMVFPGQVLGDLIFAPFMQIANKLYENADEIIAVSDTYIQRALTVNKKKATGYSVYIGTRLETFDQGTLGKPVVKKDTCDEIWIGYCGSLAISYDIPSVLYALKKLQEKGFLNIKLIVMGDGSYKNDFEKIAKQLNVNTVFTGKLPYNRMCAQLSECDIVVNPIKKGSAASIINKHSDYCASGLPVINTQDSIEYRNLVDNYKMGLNCKCEDVEDLANKLELLITNEKLRTKMGENARRCAEEKFDRKNSYKKIYEVIED